MTQAANYQGSCFCGAVQFTLTGEPAVMAYCHCHSCRQWSAGPVNAFTLWQPEQFTVVKGQDHLASFDKLATATGSGTSNRKWCTQCGGHVFIDHPAMGVVDVPAVLIDKLHFSPTFHVHYQETVHAMNDGLPKFKDLPAEAGGSGEQIAD